jgi:NAD(P)-dependent dehydrogenase (short-subunit alcohol dehydrogenase family)
MNAMSPLKGSDEMSYPSFDGQVALVTGASSGMGLAAAQAFAAAGAAVALVDVNADPQADP